MQIFEQNLIVYFRFMALLHSLRIFFRIQIFISVKRNDF